MKIRDKKVSIGDKIKCLSNAGSNSLIWGGNYSVTDINQFGNIQIQEDFGGKHVLAHYYKPERFELVKTKAKIPLPTISLGKTYKTRLGRPVNLFCLSNDKQHPVVGEWQNEIGEWNNETWTLAGSFASGDLSNLDLVEVNEITIVDCGRFEAKVYRDKSVLLRGKEEYLNEFIDKESMEQIIDAWIAFD